MKRVLLLTLLLTSCQLFGQDLRSIYETEDSAAFEQYLQLNQLIFFTNLTHKVNHAVYSVTASAAKDILNEEVASGNFSGGNKKYYLLDQRVKVFLTKRLFEKNCEVKRIRKLREQGSFFANQVIFKSNIVQPLILEGKIIDAINNTNGFSNDLFVKKAKMLQKFFEKNSLSGSTVVGSAYSLNLNYSYRVNKLILNDALNQASLNISYGDQLNRELFYFLDGAVWKRCGTGEVISEISRAKF